MRLHVHVGVSNLDQSIAFYSQLFGAMPTKLEKDYAKWMLDDPRVNFAISSRASGIVGIGHLGIQADSPAEMTALAARAKAVSPGVLEEKATNCCYAKSDKAWVTDPTGIRWEQFYSFDDSDTLANRPAANDTQPQAEQKSRCCA